MKTISKIFSVAAFSMLALVACGKKSSGGGEPAPAPTCTMAQALPPGQYCNNGALIQALPCVQGQMPQQGYTCMNGYLIPMNINMGAAGNLLNNVQFTNSSMQGTVNLSGAGAYDFNNPRIVYQYAGQVTVTGVVNVLNQSLCGATVGQYMINGTGIISMGSISNLVLTISGPVPMQLININAVLENPTDGLDRNSMNNRLGILSSNLIVNGQVNCGTITTY